MSREVDKYIEFLNSPKGKKAVQASVKEFIAKREKLEARLRRFHAKYKNNLDDVMQRLLDKYGSEAYLDRERKLGYEPREELLWFLFSYAEKYCQPCRDQRYFNEFTGAAYYVGKYVMQVMHGQGSVLRIDIQEEPIVKPTPTRFNMDATTVEEAIDYIKARATQLLRFGYKLSNITTHEWGVDARMVKRGKEYQAIYIIESYRSKGLYPSLVQKEIITAKQCDIKAYLTKKKIKYTALELCPFEEYKMIEDYYGADKAARSGVYLMNHIDEGLAILEWIGASELAKKAYALHPILQGDEALLKNIDKFDIKPDVLVRVMEYRNIANAYLSRRNIIDINEIRLSPIKDVNDMLIADKIQNRKDFELYHEGNHARSPYLAQYFRNWLKRLNISEKEYQNYKLKLS